MESAGNRIAIRRAGERDLPALVDLHRQPHLYQDRLNRQYAGLGDLLIGWLAERAVGVLYLRWEPADEPELRQGLPNVPILNNLQVHRAYQRRRVATTLIEDAERRVRGKGRPTVALGVALDNTAALNLYQGLGYKEWTRDPIPTTAEDFLPGGIRRVRPDRCRVFTKDL